MKVLFAVFSYLVGAIPSGYIIYFIFEQKDIRKFGSLATGATNILRLKGWKFAVPVMIIDLFKGFLPAYLALQLFNDNRYALICAFLAIIGHCYPVYIKFKGGKGVATSIGAFAALAVLPLLIGLAVFVLVVALFRYVSLGSLLAAISLIPSTFFITGDHELVIFSAAVFLLIVFRHAGNISRLAHGQERKLGQRNQ
jgi:glycerol-3-phosphate acyltransferase PlsY